MDNETLSSLAAGIVRNSRVKSFPEDYYDTGEEDVVNIPIGEQVSMFRQDEYVVVSIDDKRLYFMKVDEAKYIFYSAKRGQSNIPSPRNLDLSAGIEKFENDMDSTLHDINEIAKGLDGAIVDSLKKLCSNLLGYSDIF